ncbi:transposase of ISAar22, IS481 family [Arthrobacter sp. PAMC 25486]|nr:transposase of ISAar22, IS481 family [Arthrobacter sp. PAMC 25486]
MAQSGWDNGLQSIWFEGVDTDEFAGTILAVATIGRILAGAGMTKTIRR